MGTHSTRFQMVAVLIYFMCIILASIPLQQTKARENGGEVNIATSPSSAFIHVDGMAPGDREVATLYVHNSGAHDFRYGVSSRLDAGNPELFSALTLTIADRQTTLYEGSLSALDNVELGALTSSGEQALTFTAMLPKHAGNELQGQSASVAFEFVASSSGAVSPPDLPPDPGDTANTSGTAVPRDSEKTPSKGTLPKTATSWYNVLLIGIMLIGLGTVIWRLRKGRI